VPSWLTRAGAAQIASLAVLLVTGIMGLVNNDGLRLARTPVERLVGIAVIGYGVTGLLAGTGYLARWAWTRHVVVLWAVATVTAATAPTAWDQTTPWYATMLAGLGALAIVLPVVIHVRRALLIAVTQAAGKIRDAP
jgi:energy-converting hydrogenase Eha subunit C